MGKYNFNNFQIPHSGIEAINLGLGSQMSRSSSERMSNFGALQYGVRVAGDYTKVAFGANAFVQNPAIPAFFPTGNAGNWGGAINNPYLVGSTTHKVRHDEFNVMTLGSRVAKGVSQPKFDTMDTSLVWDTAAGNISYNTTISGNGGATTVSGSYVNFPSEGWSTFGGRTGGPYGYQQVNL